MSYPFGKIVLDNNCENCKGSGIDTEGFKCFLCEGVGGSFIYSADEEESECTTIDV